LEEKDIIFVLLQRRDSDVIRTIWGMRMIIANKIPVRIMVLEEYGPVDWFQNVAR
jgi:hypothetical protein